MTQRAGKAVGSDKPNARRKTTVTTRKAERQAKARGGAKKIARAVMPKRARKG